MNTKQYYQNRALRLLDKKIDYVCNLYPPNRQYYQIREHELRFKIKHRYSITLLREFIRDMDDEYPITLWTTDELYNSLKGGD